MSGVATDMTAEECFESLTGFEEIAIAKHFGTEITDLAEKRPLAFVRALVFIELVRGGQNANDAKTSALSMTVKDANGYFAEEPDEPMPEEPTSAVGEDASAIS